MAINSGQDKTANSISYTKTLDIYIGGILQPDYHVVDININLGMADDTAILEYRAYAFNDETNRAEYSIASDNGGIVEIKNRAGSANTTIFKGIISSVNTGFSADGEANSYECTGYKNELAKIPIRGAHVVAPEGNVKFIPTAKAHFGEEYMPGIWNNYQRTSGGQNESGVDSGAAFRAFRHEDVYDDDGENKLTIQPTAWDVIDYLFAWYGADRAQGVEDDVREIIEGKSWSASLADNAYGSGRFVKDAKAVGVKDYDAWGISFLEAFNYAVNLTGPYSWYFDYATGTLQIVATAKYSISAPSNITANTADKYTLSLRPGLELSAGARDTKYSSAMPEVLSANISMPLRDIHRVVVLGEPKTFESTFWSSGAGVLTKGWTDEEAADFKADPKNPQYNHVYRDFILNWELRGGESGDWVASKFLGLLMSDSGQQIVCRAGVRHILGELMTKDSAGRPRPIIYWNGGESVDGVTTYSHLAKKVTADTNDNDFGIMFSTDSSNRYPVMKDKNTCTYYPMAVTAAYDSEYHLEAVAFETGQNMTGDKLTFEVKTDHSYYDVGSGKELENNDDYGFAGAITPTVAIMADTDFFYGRRQNAVLNYNSFSTSLNDFVAAGNTPTTDTDGDESEDSEIAARFADAKELFYGSTIIDDRIKMKRYAAQKFIEAMSLFNSGEITLDNFYSKYKPGQFISNVKRGGETIDVHAPITSVSFDLQSMTTKLSFGAP